MGDSLLAAEDHAEIRETSCGYSLQGGFERFGRGRLLVFAQGRREIYLPAVAHAAHPGGRDDGAADDACGAWRVAHGVGVVEVARGLADEVEEQLVDVAQPVATRVRASLHLVPDDAVAQRPALVVGEVEGDLPRDAELTLAAVGVAEVEPKSEPVGLKNGAAARR